MTKKSRFLRKKKERPSLAQQLGLNRWDVMESDEKKEFHRMLLSYQLGVNSEYPEKLREFIVETIPKNKKILRHLQRKKKGWHLQRKSLEEISSFLKHKFSIMPQIKMKELTGYIDRSVRRWQYDYNANMASIYEEVFNSNMDPERKRVLLNRISDRARDNNDPDPRDTIAMNYFDFVSQGKKLPTFVYSGDDSKIYIIFGTTETGGGSISHEFTRALDGTIRSTYPPLDLKDPETQARMQEWTKGSIEYCARHIAEKREDKKKHPDFYNHFFYMSNVQSGDWKFSDRQPEDENPVLMGESDWEVIGILSSKYQDQIEESKEHVFFNFHGVIRSVNMLVFKPGFLQSYDDMHPREVAEQLVEDIEDAYAKVLGTSDPEGGNTQGVSAGEPSSKPSNSGNDLEARM